MADKVTVNDEVNGSIYFNEQAAAQTDVTAYGQLWVKNATPNELWFTDDAGNDVQLGTGGYVDRGDPSSYDYTEANFTKDGTYHDLDISSIVGVGSRFVLTEWAFSATAVDKNIVLRENGNTNVRNAARTRTIVANKTVNDELWVQTDSNGVIEYAIDSATWNFITMVVRGWF